MLILSNGKFIKEPSDNNVINNVALSALGVDKILSGGDVDNKILKHIPVGKCYCSVCVNARRRAKTSVRVPEDEYNNTNAVINDLKEKIEDSKSMLNNAYNKIANASIERQVLKKRITNLECELIKKNHINDKGADNIYNKYIDLKERYTELQTDFIKCKQELELKNNIDKLDDDSVVKNLPDTNYQEKEELISQEVEEILSKYYFKLSDLLSSSLYSYKTAVIIKDGDCGVAFYFNKTLLEDNPKIVETDITTGRGYFGLIVRYDENTNKFYNRAGLDIDPDDIEYYIPIPDEIKEELFIP